MKRVIIVDDEEYILDMLGSFFRRHGYDVETVNNDVEAVASYSRQPGGVVITDLFMMGRGGFGVIRDLKKSFPEAKIIAISGGYQNLPVSRGSAKQKGLAFAKEYGAAKTFPKPVDLKELLQAVEELSDD